MNDMIPAISVRDSTSHTGHKALPTLNINARMMAIKNVIKKTNPCFVVRAISFIFSRFSIFLKRLRFLDILLSSNLFTILVWFS